jgi:hypothetical protein
MYASVATTSRSSRLSNAASKTFALLTGHKAIHPLALDAAYNQASMGPPYSITDRKEDPPRPQGASTPNTATDQSEVQISGKDRQPDPQAKHSSTRSTPSSAKLQGVDTSPANDSGIAPEKLPQENEAKSPDPVQETGSSADMTSSGDVTHVSKESETEGVKEVSHK